MSKYQTFIFDLDGTLLDTLQDLADSVNYALRQHRMPQHSLDDIRRFVGNGVRKLMERAVPEGTQNPLFETVFADFRQYYMHHSMDTTRPYDGIPELLQQLKQRGCRMAVVSNKMMAATQELVAHFFPEIEVAIGEHEAEGIRKKPAPDTVYEALRQLATSSDPSQGGESPAGCKVTANSSPLGRSGEVVYVGDSEVDIQTARNSGLPCISVLWGFRDQQFLKENGATTFVATPCELLEL